MLHGLNLVCSEAGRQCLVSLVSLNLDVPASGTVLNLVERSSRWALSSTRRQMAPRPATSPLTTSGAHLCFTIWNTHRIPAVEGSEKALTTIGQEVPPDTRSAVRCVGGVLRIEIGPFDAGEHGCPY